MRTRSICRLIICAGLLSASFGGNASAAEPGDCASFAWPVTTEIEWLKSADANLDAIPGKAIALSLVPASQAGLTAGKSGKKKEGKSESFGGVVHFAGGTEAATYQVSLPKKGWIDVVQNGKALTSSAHSGKTDCDALRKSVRFEIAPGPFSVELSGFTENAIKFTIRRAE